MQLLSLNTSITAIRKSIFSERVFLCDVIGTYLTKISPYIVTIISLSTTYRASDLSFNILLIDLHYIHQVLIISDQFMQWFIDCFVVFLHKVSV